MVAGAGVQGKKSTATKPTKSAKPVSNLSVEARANVTRPTQHTITPASANVIAVGCKLPLGIHLDMRKLGEPTTRFTLKGTNSQTAGMLIRPSVIGGFAITEGVPKEFFEAWMEQNRFHPAVANGLIFAHVEVASVRDMGEEREELKHGLEPIDPRAPARGVVALSDAD